MLMKGFPARFIAASTERESSHDGCRLFDRFSRGERYEIDFADDFTAEGWKQFDTDQDAHYFGVWVNPRFLLTLTYAEGDWTLVECVNRDAYRGEIERAIEFYGEGRMATVISDDGSVTVCRQDRQQFFEDKPDKFTIRDVLEAVLS